GNFWLRDGKGPMICIAGGSGLAPVLSILEQAVKQPIGRPCVVLFGAITENDLYGLEMLKEIEKAWDGAFVFAPVLSHEEDGSPWQGHRRFVNTAISAVAGAYISDE